MPYKPCEICGKVQPWNGLVNMEGRNIHHKCVIAELHAEARKNPIPNALGEKQEDVATEMLRKITDKFLR